MNSVLQLVGVLIPSNKRFALAHFGLRCFPNELEWILLLLFTLSSFSFTSSDRARLQPWLGYFYFCRFLLLWGGSNSNWTSSSGFARDRQVRPMATDGEGESGRTRNNPRIKDSGFPWLSSPHLLSLPSSTLWLLPHLSVSCSVFLTWSVAQACTGLLGFGFTLQSPEESCLPLCLLVGRWRVSWSSPQGWGAMFFPQICTRLVCFFLY